VKSILSRNSNGRSPNSVGSTAIVSHFVRSLPAGPKASLLRCLAAILLLTAIAETGHAQTLVTWLGTNSPDWDDPGNWLNETMPSSVDSIHFDTTANILPTIPRGTTASGFGLDGTPSSGFTIFLDGQVTLGAGGISVAESLAGLETVFNGSSGFLLDASTSFSANQSHLNISSPVNFSTSVTLTLNGGAGSNSRISGILQGNATTAIVKEGLGKWTLAGFSTNYAGLITVKNGTLEVTGSRSLGPPTTTAGTVVESGASLLISTTAAVTIAEPLTVAGIGENAQGAAVVSNFNGTTTLSRSISLSADARIRSQNSGTLILSGGIVGAGHTVGLDTDSGATITVTGAISAQSGGLLKTGAGTVNLNAINLQTGLTTINAGTVNVGTGGTLGAASSSFRFNAGTLNLNNPAQTLASFSGTGGTINFGTGHTLTLAEISASAYSGVMGGGGNLALSGGGTMTLSGDSSNTYSGTTVVSSGTLALAKSGGATAVSGSTITVGTGSAFSALRFDASNQIFSGTALNLGGSGNLLLSGNSQSFSTPLTLSGNATIDFGTGGTANVLAFGNSAATTWSGTLTVLNFNVGTDTLRFGNSASGLTSGQLGLISFSGFSASLDSTGAVQFASAIPEPSTYAAIFGSAALALAVYRRRRRTELASGAAPSGQD
jgi:fibronectin-binding autotransporter adhesin